MSLDFSLTEVEEVRVFGSNITSNLTEMADKCGLYYALWRPEEKGYKKAKDIILTLTKGLDDLKKRPDYFKKFNPENGWGDYCSFVEFVEEVLDACKENPNAKIKTWI